MPNLRLRRISIVPAYPNSFRVILTMKDGFELEVGGVSEEGGTHGRRFWAWSAPGASGQMASRDEAMLAVRDAFTRVTPDVLASMRAEQEWTANKYALWEAGYRNQLGRDQIKCRCGQLFDPGAHDETMAHIGHITGRQPGTNPPGRT